MNANTLHKLAAIAAVVLPSFELLAEEVPVFRGRDYSGTEERIDYNRRAVTLDGLVSFEPGQEADAGTISGRKYAMTETGELLVITVSGSYREHPCGALSFGEVQCLQVDNSAAEALDLRDVAQTLQLAIDKKHGTREAPAAARRLALSALA